MQAKKKKRRCSSSSPDMKFQLFISQACHINKGSILGLSAKRRNKNSVETKNVRIDHEWGGRVVLGVVKEEQTILAKLSLYGGCRMNMHLL